VPSASAGRSQPFPPPQQCGNTTATLLPSFFPAAAPGLGQGGGSHG